MFIITQNEFFFIGIALCLYLQVDVLVQIIAGEEIVTKDILRKDFMKLVFRLYLVLLISKVYFPLTVAWGDKVNFKMPIVLLRPIQGFIEAYGNMSIGKVIYNIGGNLILLAPMAFFLCYYFKELFFSKKRIAITIFFISLFIESTQVVLSLVFPNVVRFFEINDIILNTIGGLLGYYLYKIYKKILLIDI